MRHEAEVKRQAVLSRYPDTGGLGVRLAASLLATAGSLVKLAGTGGSMAGHWEL